MTYTRMRNQELSIKIKPTNSSSNILYEPDFIFNDVKQYLEKKYPDELLIDSTNNGKVEILDAATNHSIATRLIPDGGIITAVGKSLRFIGETSVKDTFTISNNNKGIGDNRNILKMIDLQESDVNGLNSGSFQDIFNATAAEIGSEVRSGQLAVEDAEASKDEAKALEDERAGVSLDEEAAALIQFQQAFSANARIIQTARELFESLMVVISK